MEQLTLFEAKPKQPKEAKRKPCRVVREIPQQIEDLIDFHYGKMKNWFEKRGIVLDDELKSKIIDRYSKIFGYKSYQGLRKSYIATFNQIPISAKDYR